MTRYCNGNHSKTSDYLSLSERETKYSNSNSSSKTQSSRKDWAERERAIDGGEGLGGQRGEKETAWEE